MLIAASEPIAQTTGGVLLPPMRFGLMFLSMA